MQLDALKAAGVPPDHIFTDTATGRTLNRPGLKRFLLNARGGDTVIIWKMDRLSRSALDMLFIAKRFKDEGTHLRSITENMDTTTPIGGLALGMMAVLAEFESVTTGFRAKHGMAAVARLGRKFGPAPTFGEQHFSKAVEMLKAGKSGEEVGRHFGVTGQVVRQKIEAHYGRKFWKSRKRRKRG